MMRRSPPPPEPTNATTRPLRPAADEAGAGLRLLERRPPRRPLWRDTPLREDTRSWWERFLAWTRGPQALPLSGHRAGR